MYIIKFNIIIIKVLLLKLLLKLRDLLNKRIRIYKKKKVYIMTNTKLSCSFTATTSCSLNNKGSKWLTLPAFMNGRCSKKYQTLNNYKRRLHQ